MKKPKTDDSQQDRRIAVRVFDFLSARVRLAHVLIVVLYVFWVSAAMLRGGIVHPEACRYMMYHLSGPSLIHRVYDSKTLEGDITYQARELSYVLDSVDSGFIDLSIRLGMPHFLSLTHYVSCFLIVIILWRFCTRQLSLDGLTSACLCLMLVTSPFVMFSGSYFRTGKVAVTLVLVLLFAMLYKASTSEHDLHPPRRRTLPYLAFFGLALAGTMLERQGFFFLCLAALFLAARLISVRTRDSSVLLVICLAVLAVNTLYNHYLAPYLTFRLNGYWPSLGFQTMPWPKFWGRPWDYLKAGVVLLLDTTRFICGYVPSVYALAILVLLIWLFLATARWRVCQRGDGFREIRAIPAVAAALFLIAMAALNVLMVLRHPPLYWPDVRRVYYWLPAAGMLLMLISMAVATLAQSKLLPRILVQLVLILAVIGNVAAWDEHIFILRNGHLKPSYENTPTLIESLRFMQQDPLYQPPPKVAQDTVYRFFAARMRGGR